jgi:ribosome-associated protein
MEPSILKRLNAVAQAIYDKKGFNILVLDVRGVCSMTDYFIIAEGTVDRHVKALAGTVVDLLDKEKEHPLYVEGMQEGDWVVLDYVDFIVHVFTPELRERYRLEALWSEGKVIDVKIAIPDAPTTNQAYNASKRIL